MERGDKYKQLDAEEGAPIAPRGIYPQNYLPIPLLKRNKDDTLRMYYREKIESL